ncbi:MAG: histidine phosphatase family protein [Candidatus Limnocylindria bacterium]
MSDRRLLLVRHGVTDWNREGRFQGHLDPPLADAGRHEARFIAARLRADDALRPARIISSSLGRALQTATIIGDAVKVPVTPDARLMEIGQGEWEGRTHTEIAVSDAERYAAWRREAGVRQPPGGERIEAAARRVASVVDQLSTTDGAWPVCLVSHGGTLRLVARVLLGLGITSAWALDVDNASLSVALRIEEGWRLERWNDAHHLLGREETHVDEAEGRPLAL